MIFALTVLEVVGIIYVYGFKRVLEDIRFMLGIELGIYWKFCWGFLVPVALSFFFIYYSITFEPITYAGNSYPDAAICKYILIFRKKFHYFISQWARKFKIPAQKTCEFK